MSTETPPAEEAEQGPTVEQPTAEPTAPLTNTVERRTWEEFRTTGLLWAANTVLHWFGWAIVLVYDDSDPSTAIGAYPVRCKWRGFPVESNDRGIKKLSDWMASAGESLRKDIEE